MTCLYKELACVAALLVNVFECHDPASGEGGKGPSSFSQESSANHFLRYTVLRKKNVWRFGDKDRWEKEEKASM